VKDKTKSIFDWLNEITLHKSPAEEFTGNDWEKFNSYMIHRFISCNRYYIELANLAQSIPPQNKKQVYNLYKEMIPKGKSYFKYIKSKTKQPNKELIEKLTPYFKLGSSEIITYINILDKKDLTNILNEMGVDDKEKKKLMK
jgi:hypothetical protein